jgi:hypothetical protein
LKEIDSKTFCLSETISYEKAELSSVVRHIFLSAKETTGSQWVQQHREAFCIMVYSQQETLIKMV